MRLTARLTLSLMDALQDPFYAVGAAWFALRWRLVRYLAR